MTMFNDDDSFVPMSVLLIEMDAVRNFSQLAYAESYPIVVAVVTLFDLMIWQSSEIS